MSVRIVLLWILAGLFTFATGSAVELPDFRVSEEDYPGTFKQDKACAAYDGQGNYVVCWRDYRSGSAYLYFQRFDGSGQALGANQQVAAVYDGSSEPPPAVAMNQSGHILIAYRSHFSTIHVVRYDENGDQYGAAMQVSGIGMDVQFCQNVGVALNDQGHGIVVFRAKLFSETDYRLLGQCVDFTSGPVGQNFFVSESREPEFDTHPLVRLGESDHAFCLWVGEELGKTSIAFSRFRYTEAAALPETMIDSSYDVEGDYRYITEDPALAIHPGGFACLLWTGTYWDEIGFNSYAYCCDTSFIRLVDTSGSVILDRHAVVDNTLLPSGGSSADLVAFDTTFGILGSVFRGNFYLQEFGLDGMAVGPYATLAPGDSGNYHYDVMMAPVTGDAGAVAWRSTGGSGDAGDVATQGFLRDGAEVFELRRVHDDVGAAQSFPVVVFDSSGSSLALWIDYRESSGGDVWGQRFDPSGNSIGSNFRLNDAPPKEVSCSQLEVASNGGGRAVAVWVSASSGGRSVLFQALDYPDFEPVGGNESVLTQSSSFEYYWPDVGVRPDGSFVVAYRQQPIGYVVGTYLKAYGSDLNPDGDPIKVNDTPGEEIGLGFDGLLFDYAPGIAMQPSGSCAVVWIEHRDLPETPWDDHFIVAQFFSSLLLPSGGNILVSDSNNGVANCSNEEIPPDAVVNEYGEYAFAWTGGNRSDYYGLWTRLYNSSGVPISIQVKYCEQDLFNYHPSARVAAGPDHEFLGVWYTAGDEDPDVYAQKFNSAGVLLGAPMLISNDAGGERQSYPVADAYGTRLAFVWEDFRSGSGNADIYARYTDWLFLGAICGDVNADGDGPNIVDLTYLVAYLFGGGDPPPIEEAADVNGDGNVNIVDLTDFVNYLFDGGPEPDCGR